MAKKRRAATPKKMRSARPRRARTERAASAAASRARRGSARLKRSAARAAETLTRHFRLARRRPASRSQDPEARFTVRRLSDNRQVADQFIGALTGHGASFDLPVATGEAVVCELDLKRYRFARSPIFFRTPGPPVKRGRASCSGAARVDAGLHQVGPALRAAFADLKRVLTDSKHVELFKTGIDLKQLAGDRYDDLAGADELLAKTALLNTHCRLNTPEPVSQTRSWFSFVREIIAIGRERFLAMVDPEMEALVRQIHEHIDDFRADYERTPAENHRGNVPAALQPRIASMVSIKSTHAKGNFQLTITHLANPDEVLLDTDIDENGDLLGHLFDLVKHKLNGGTHPHDVHEILVYQHHEQGAAAPLDLGYRLV